MLGWRRRFVSLSADASGSHVGQCVHLVCTERRSRSARSEKTAIYQAFSGGR
jgi:hypothetical protein